MRNQPYDLAGRNPDFTGLLHVAPNIQIRLGVNWVDKDAKRILSACGYHKLVYLKWTGGIRKYHPPTLLGSYQHQLEVTMISHQPVTRKVLSVSILIFPDDGSPYPNPLGPHHIPHETVDVYNV